MITAKGRELALKIAPAVPVNRITQETCSLICRHAATHHAYSELACNRELTAREAAKVDWLEARISALIESLPLTSAGPFGAFFQGDPRGCTVGLTAPPEWVSLYDGWGRDRINVPQ